MTPSRPRLVRRFLLGALLLAPLPRAARAQDGAHEAAHLPPPLADSAGAARAAFRAGMAAFRRGDLAGARDAVRRAAGAWPAQPVYAYHAAALAARARDTADAVHWLHAYAALGLGADLAADSAFAPLAAAPGVVAVAEELRRNARPDARSSAAFALRDSTFYPEGIAFDPASGRWFVGSVRQRRIVAVDRDGRARDFGAAGGPLLGAFGMTVDERRRLLWVATSALPRMEGFDAAAHRGRAGVLALDLASGRLVRQLWLPPDSTERALGDVALAPNGDLYASDSRTGVLYVARAGSDSLARLAAHPLLRSPQGMAITPDGRAMYVADYSHGILRVELPDGRVSAVPSPAGTTALGIDGLYLHGRALVGIQNGVAPPRVVALCLAPGGERITRLAVLDRNAAVADEPTLGAIAGGALHYVATSAWEKYDDAGRRVPGTTLRPVTVLRLPLEDRACE